MEGYTNDPFLYDSSSNNNAYDTNYYINDTSNNNFKGQENIIWGVDNYNNNTNNVYSGIPYITETNHDIQKYFTNVENNIINSNNNERIYLDSNNNIINYDNDYLTNNNNINGEFVNYDALPNDYNNNQYDNNYDYIYQNGTAIGGETYLPHNEEYNYPEINDIINNLSSNHESIQKSYIETIKQPYYTYPLNHDILIQNNKVINQNQNNILIPQNNKNIFNTYGNYPVYINNSQSIKKEQSKELQNQPNQSNPINIEYQNANTIIPPPKPIKRRPLEKKDFIDIIYKDIGIINLGNTCFINSCLQILIHCPNFIYKFYEKVKTLKKEDTPISYYFFTNVCFPMVDTVNTQEKYIDITNFKNEFGKKHPSYGGYMQNDAQEFCRVFLEDLSTELNEVKVKGFYKQLTNSDKKTKIERDEEFDFNFKERENSIITDLFYAQIVNTFICECKSTFYSFQKLLDFPLLLPENTPNIGIMDLLKNYFKAETIDFEIKCEKCQKVVQHKKEIKISRPPEILILSLQRIDHATQKKNECIVTFPPILDMSEFIDQECGFNKEPIYNLFAIVNHTGAIDFGHYYSDIKFKNSEEFYEFNDSSVTKIGKDIENFPYAYALFYIKNPKMKKLK